MGVAVELYECVGPAVTGFLECLLGLNKGSACSYVENVVACDSAEPGDRD